MPTAFSPNGDGKNDLFRANINGVVQKYQLTIFNRWGQVIFQTEDYTKGWNGDFNGKPIETTGVAWVCIYQLEGGELKKETGLVVIVK